MKIIEVNELKNEACKGPFYSIIDKTKVGEDDPRACGCATLALLNATLTLKEKLKIRDERTAFDEMRCIQNLTNEQDNTVEPQDMLEFIDKHSIFNSCRMLVMNPNGMNEEVFIQIFLRRLAQGNLILAMIEIPNDGEPAKDILNHASFIHCEDGEVFFDGLKADLTFLLRAFYFSKPTTLLFFSVNPGELHGR
jgi:hypothetical protein